MMLDDRVERVVLIAIVENFLDREWYIRPVGARGLLVDDDQLYLGSQNFDWRALTQIQLLVGAELADALAIPEGVGLHATITLGHPAGHHGPVRRRPLAELVFEDGWEQAATWAVDPPGTQWTQAGPPTSAPR